MWYKHFRGHIFLITFTLKIHVYLFMLLHWLLLVPYPSENKAAFNSFKNALNISYSTVLASWLFCSKKVIIPVIITFMAMEYNTINAHFWSIHIHKLHVWCIHPQAISPISTNKLSHRCTTQMLHICVQ